MKGNLIQYHSIAWHGFQNKFLAENDSHKRYEVWTSFSIDKITDGVAKMERKIEMKKGLKEKQMAVEIEKYKEMLELKQVDNTETDKLST